MKSQTRYEYQVVKSLMVSCRINNPPLCVVSLRLIVCHNLNIQFYVSISSTTPPYITHHLVQEKILTQHNMGGGPDKEHLIIAHWDPEPKGETSLIKQLFPYIDITYVQVSRNIRPNVDNSNQISDGELILMSKA